MIDWYVLRSIIRRDISASRLELLLSGIHRPNVNLGQREGKTKTRFRIQSEKFVGILSWSSIAVAIILLIQIGRRNTRTAYALAYHFEAE
jgi:hypothetical protein